MSLLDLIPGSSIVSIATKVIDRVLPDEELKKKAETELEVLKQTGELNKIINDQKTYEIEQSNVTSRWGYDLSSDSALSKNIRPFCLMAILLSYFIFAMMSAFGLNANELYVQLLGQWGMLIMSAYFGGRTLEKIIDMKRNK